MPKIKKSKAVSLVSAYESGAESDASGEENELSEEESTSERSASSTRSSTAKLVETTTTTATNEVEMVEFTSKDEIKQSDDSVHAEECFEESRKREVISETNRETHQLPSDNVQEDEAASDQSKDASHSIYTLENGFPPGCEHIRLPPEPKAQCSQTLQNKISLVVERMKRYNYSINEDIHKKKNFKNPSIYEKLIEAHGIDEFGSNFPDHLDNLKEHGYMFYDELDEAQRADWARKEKERKERTKIEMVSATKKK